MKNKILYFGLAIVLGAILIIFSGCEKNESLTQNNTANEVYSKESNTSNNTNKTNNTSNTSKTNEVKTNQTNKEEAKSEKNFNEKKVDKLSDVSWKYKKIDFSDLKWLNTEKCGNICIPSNWNRDKDVQILDENAIVYDLEDASETIIIDSYSSSMLKTRMKTHLEKLADDSQLEEWAYEKINFGDQTATIVNAKFSGVNHIQSTMFIATEDQSKIIEISVEASDPNVRKLLNTFTFEKLEDDAVDYYESVN